MTSDPKDVDGKSKFAPGEMSDGKIDIMTEDEARLAIVDRDAEEAAFDALLDDSDEDAEFEAASQPQPGDDPDDVYEAE